jgi:hypothetical protein
MTPAFSYRFNWQEVFPQYWIATVAGYTLHVYQYAEHQDIWTGEIVSSTTAAMVDRKDHLIDKIVATSENQSAAEMRELMEHALMRFLGKDALTVGAAYVANLVEKKWGISTNNFLSLTFPSILDAQWSEMYIPDVGRCFVVQSQIQWYWITVMDTKHQVSGTAKTLHEAKRESVLAAISLHMANQVRMDYDTLWMRAFSRLPNAELQ